MDFMKKIIKKVLKNHKGLQNYIYTVYKEYRYTKSIFKTLIFAIKGLFLTYTPSYKINRGEQIKKSFSKAKINIDNDDNFVFSIDPYKLLYSDLSTIENTTIDYEICLNKSLNDLKKEIENLKSGDYKNTQLNAIEAIEILLNKVIQSLKKSNKKNKEKYIKYFENIKDRKAESFEEALQRILFYNQVLWQSGHNLNGLGRLDKILDSYYKNDKKMDKEKASKLIEKFIGTLHSYYWIKSSALLGDTGQIIILGGMDEKKHYFSNDVTYIFIEAIKKLQLPDPKVLLRISKNTPRDLIKLSIDCIKTGVGCPLFANDDVIIPKLIKFGYEKKDAYNYVTSACWEPLIPNKSVEQNNIRSLVFMRPFNEMLNSEDLSKIDNTKDLIKTYKVYLEEYVKNFIIELDNIEYEIDPIMSMFVPNCNTVEKDVTKGGSYYNNFGATSVSLSNVVNSIINVDKLVFNEKKYSLQELNELRKNNYNGSENVVELLKNQPIRFGKDDEYVYDIFNDITTFTNKILEKTYNKNGGRLKIGFSAPTYIIESKDEEASFDGRKNGDPFIVHISSDIPSLAYTELINFASKLDYTGNRFNGNVIDFMVTPSFIENNEEKFIDFLMLSINVGFFEMQMNVVSSEILIRAKENPKEFPNLIVRVWGFSSYFNDLPEEYKDVLIERALRSEGKSY